MKSKILIVVEGSKEEVRILGSNTHGLLSLISNEYEIVPFCSTIYELYDAYMRGEYDDLVSYLRYEKGLKIDDNILSKNAFSAIYLIFDFEPHYQKYSDAVIKKLLNLFSNETELGKLYINYPMVEAYYHLLNLPDLEYNKRKISLDYFNGHIYKKEVNMTTCLKKNKLSKKDLCYIIWHNFNKAKYICNNNEIDVIDHAQILNLQINMKNSNNEIYILSTFPLFIIDYNIEKTLEMLKDVLKLDNVLV